MVFQLPNYLLQYFLTLLVVKFNLLKTIFFGAFISCDQWFELAATYR